MTYIYEPWARDGDTWYERPAVLVLEVDGWRRVLLRGPVRPDWSWFSGCNP